jgi:hypothetical protein
MQRRDEFAADEVAPHIGTDTATEGLESTRHEAVGHRVRVE